jgi:hypothetical protein
MTGNSLFSKFVVLWYVVSFPGNLRQLGGLGMTVDFAAVQWSRRMAEALEGLRGLEAEDLRRLGPLIEGMVNLTEGGIQLSDQQLTVILQNMFNKHLTQIQVDKGGVVVEFTGGGFEYERFLVRADGRVPNSRYQAKRVEREA